MFEPPIPADDQLSSAAADGPTPATTAGPATAGRISRVLWSVLVLAVGLLIGAAVLAQRADGRHDRAIVGHRTAAAVVEAQQSRSAASDLQYSAKQSAASSFEKADADPLATAQQATQLSDQASANTQQELAAGLSGTDRDYNAAVEAGNRLVDQVNGLMQQFGDQMDQLPTP